MTQSWQGLTTGACPTTPSKKQGSWGAQGAAPAPHTGDHLEIGDGLWSGVGGGPRKSGQSQKSLVMPSGP